MSGLRLKPGVKIGAIAAELDDLLSEAFVDTGYLSKISNPSDRHFIVLGRTGVGKSALFKKLEENKSFKISNIDPDNLSMQYLQNSQVLKEIQSWGVNLEIFYKFLWKHVLILELIRIRFQGKEEIPSRLSNIFSIDKILNYTKERKKEEAKKSAIKYLNDYGNEYWIKTDTRIKKITEELENSLSQNASLKTTGVNVPLSAEIGANQSQKKNTKVETETVERAQSIVNDFLLSDLNKVIDLLAQDGFQDDQKKYFILIDDLDKNWMYDDAIYLSLLKSLLFSVADLNRKIPSMKVVISLRENLYYRIFKRADKHEPQKEKLDDQTLHIKWEKSSLIQLVDQRLQQLFQGQYSKHGNITFEQIVPPNGKKVGLVNTVDYIIERTLMRPRDLIDFLNIYIEKSSYLKSINWQQLRLAEAEYSKRRLDAVVDEWKDSYLALINIFPQFIQMSAKFSPSDITTEKINKFLSTENNDCMWFAKLQEDYLNNRSTEDDVRDNLLKVLFRVGIIGFIDNTTAAVIYSYDQSTTSGGIIANSSKYQFNPTFYSALRING